MQFIIHVHCYNDLIPFLVSHKGHSTNYHESIPKDNTVYSLQDQIQHKVDCIDTLIQENGPETNFIFVGHSIGSYISAEVLKQRPNHNITRVLALFPTLRDIAITPNGVNITVSMSFDIDYACFTYSICSVW